MYNVCMSETSHELTFSSILLNESVSIICHALYEGLVNLFGNISGVVIAHLKKIGENSKIGNQLSTWSCFG